MEALKIIGAYVGSIVGFFLIIFLISWAAMGNNFFLYKFFAPRQEAVRRQVFQQTPSYINGIIQEVRAAKYDYDKNDDAGKKAAAYQYARSQADQLEDKNVLPPDLAAWLYSNPANPVLGR